MEYLATYELFGFGKRRYTKGISKVNNIVNKEGTDSLFEPFYELTDMGLEVTEKGPNPIDNNSRHKYPIWIQIHKGNPTGVVFSNNSSAISAQTFTINDDIKDIVFSGIGRIENKFSLRLDSIIIQYEWNPMLEADGLDKLIIKNEKDWVKKLDRNSNVSFFGGLGSFYVFSINILFK